MGLDGRGGQSAALQVGDTGWRDAGWRTLPPNSCGTRARDGFVDDATPELHSAGLGQKAELQSVAGTRLPQGKGRNPQTRGEPCRDPPATAARSDRGEPPAPRVPDTSDQPRAESPKFPRSTRATSRPHARTRTAPYGPSAPPPAPPYLP